MKATQAIVRTAQPTSLLETLPAELLQKVFNYLPPKWTFVTASRISKTLNRSANYLAAATLFQARKNAFSSDARAKKSLQRFQDLLLEGLGPQVPTESALSSMNELINQLPALRYEDCPAALTALLQQCNQFLPDRREKLRDRCMQVFMEAYSNARTKDPALPKYRPGDAGEAALAAEHFSITFPDGGSSRVHILNCMQEFLDRLEWIAISATESQNKLLAISIYSFQIISNRATSWLDTHDVTAEQRQQFNDLRYDFARSAFRLLAGLVNEQDWMAYVLMLCHIAHDNQALYDHITTSVHNLPNRQVGNASPAIKTIEDFCAAGDAKARKIMFRKAIEMEQGPAKVLVLEVLAKAAFKQNAADEFIAIIDATIEAVPTTADTINCSLERITRCNADEFDAIIAPVLHVRMAMMRPGINNLKSIKEVVLGSLQAYAGRKPDNDKARIGQRLNDLIETLFRIVFRDKTASKTVSEKEREACVRFYESLYADLSALVSNPKQSDKVVAMAIEALEKHREWLR